MDLPEEYVAARAVCWPSLTMKMSASSALMMMH